MLLGPGKRVCWEGEGKRVCHWDRGRGYVIRTGEELLQGKMDGHVMDGQIDR